MTNNVVKKTFTLPTFVASELDQLSELLSRNQSSLVSRALAEYLYRFGNMEESLECWMRNRAAVYYTPPEDS